MNKNPQFTSYKSTSDLLDLRDWFYNKKVHDRRSEAIARVNAYQTRGHIPHSIESTSLLTSTIISDESGQVEDVSILQLSYTMAIIKFVNGLLDPYQQSTFAVPLHILASFLKLPSYFVELRHCGTHEFLPSLSQLRVMSGKALEWLYDHYWVEIDNLELIIDTDDLSEEEAVKFKSDVKYQIKSYKKVRKLNLNKFYKFGDSTEMGMVYWNSITDLKKLYEHNKDLFLSIMVSEKVLILDTEMNEAKTNGIRLLFKPLLEELGRDFGYDLLNKMMSMRSESVPSANLSFQIINWSKLLLSNKLQYHDKINFINDDSVEHITKLLQSKNSQINISLLEYLLDRQTDLLTSEQKSSIASSIEVMRKFKVGDKELKEFQSASGSNKRAVLADFSADLESLRKRMKQTKAANTIEKIPKVLWESVEDWEPTPFGVCI